jgi:CysZ protein
VSEAPAQPADVRPGTLRRAAAGAWHVPAGFSYLLRNPGLWPLSLLPLLLTAACLALGFLAGASIVIRLGPSLIPPAGGLPDVLGFLMTLLLWAGALVAGLLAGLAVALLLSAPALERLSRRVEARVAGRVAESPASFVQELLQAFRAALYFALVAPLVFVLGLVPVVGPPIAAAWGAHALAHQHTEAPLARRGMGFAARREWHRRWRAESMGFGVAALVTLIVPFANLLLAPALAVGATLLVLELEGDA